MEGTGYQNKCSVRHYRYCGGGHAERGNDNSGGGRRKNKKSRGKRQILQAVLLAYGLSRRHPENGEQEEEESSCQIVPRQVCQRVPVKTVTNKCEQVINNHSVHYFNIS